MMEPITPVVCVPSGGWSPCLLRMHMLDRPFGEAVFWLAEHSRRSHMGVICELAGVDLVIWPHQSVREIERTFERLKAEGAQ